MKARKQEKRDGFKVTMASCITGAVLAGTLFKLMFM